MDDMFSGYTKKKPGMPGQIINNNNFNNEESSYAM
jgi:hypothetical protein